MLSGAGALLRFRGYAPRRRLPEPGPSPRRCLPKPIRGRLASRDRLSVEGSRPESPGAIRSFEVAREDDSRMDGAHALGALASTVDSSRTRKPRLATAQATRDVQLTLAPSFGGRPNRSGNASNGNVSERQPPAMALLRKARLRPWNRPPSGSASQPGSCAGASGHPSSSSRFLLASTETKPRGGARRIRWPGPWWPVKGGPVLVNTGLFPRIGSS